MGKWPKQLFLDRASPHTARFVWHPQLGIFKLLNNFILPFGMHARATGIFSFPCQTTARSFLLYPLLFTPFLPRPLGFKVTSSREIVRM
jgi:hypothetical protein